MNREIKFRAWHKDLKKMFKIGQITLEKGTWNFEPNDRDFIGMSIPYQPSFVLMQYTGLKDKNGKEIYEGDIVKSYYYIDTPNGEQERFNQKVINYNDVLCEYKINAFENLEVIGNIYENPELLEE